jgi:hypothetical protein
MEEDPINILTPSLLQTDYDSVETLPVITAFARGNLRYVLIVISAILVFCVCTIAVSAQTAPSTAPEATETKTTDLTTVKDFRPLFGERDDLIEQLRKLDQDVDDLQAKIRGLRPADVLERELERAKAVLEKLEQRASAPPTPEQQNSIDVQARSVVQISENLQTMKTSKPILDANKADQSRKRARMRDVEQRIASLFDATRDVNQFRLYATITFGVLVFIVVGGFYLIAWNKQGVAQTIFAGELGMQFVTLFLIVIAIILFGIMGTLEGKELSALLGGLSGYILGRAGTKRSAAPPTDPKQNGKTQGDTQTEEPVT